MPPSHSYSSSSFLFLLFIRVFSKEDFHLFSEEVTEIHFLCLAIELTAGVVPAL